MISAAVTVMTTKTASWMPVFFLMCSAGMSGPLVEGIGSTQRVARGVGAGQLAYGAAPLQLKLGQVAFEAGAGEERRVQPAQREVENCVRVGEVAAEPFRDVLLYPREG